MLYECYPVDADYQIAAPGWWGFRGTGVRRGTAIPGLIGGESDRVYPDARTPRPLQVLSHTASRLPRRRHVQPVRLLHRPLGRGSLQRRHPALGVRLVDLCDKPLGRTTRDFARQVTANLLHGFAVGPVGLRHPAEDNLDEFDLPLVNGVTAS